MHVLQISEEKSILVYFKVFHLISSESNHTSIILIMFCVEPCTTLFYFTAITVITKGKLLKNILQTCCKYINTIGKILIYQIIKYRIIYFYLMIPLADCQCFIVD